MSRKNPLKSDIRNIHLIFIKNTEFNKVLSRNSAVKINKDMPQIWNEIPAQWPGT